MSKLKIEDFDGLNVGPYAEKVSKVDDMGFLVILEKFERSNGNRKGALDALNKRQGELVEEQEGVDLGEFDFNLFKDALQEIDDVEKLKKVLEDSRNADDPEVEKAVIERLAEVQKAEAKEDIPAPPKQEEEAQGPGNEDKEVRPATQEEMEEAWAKDLSETIKMARLDLDKMVAKIQHHMGINETPERSILLAKAWLGECLGVLKEENPYKNEHKITDRSQIPATADRDLSHAFKAECVQFNNINTEIAVIALRKELAEVIEFLEHTLGYQDVSYVFNIAITQAYVHAREARFALGVILGSLKV